MKNRKCFIRKVKILVFTALIASGIALPVIAQNPTDDCASAPTLYGTTEICSSPTSYTLLGSFSNTASRLSGCQSADYEDGWYRFSATANVTAVQLSGNYSHVVAVYSGSCSGLTLLGCDQENAGVTAVVSVATTPGITYFIQVHRTSGSSNSDMSGTICVYNPTFPGGLTANLQLWLKADKGSYENTGGTDPAEFSDPVLYWQDQSTGLRHASIAGSTGTMAYLTRNAMNFNPGVTYINDGDYYLRTSSNPATAHMSVVAVYRTEQQVSGGDHWNSPCLVSGELDFYIADYSLGLANGQGFFKAWNGNGYGNPAPTNTADSLPHILYGRRQRQSGGILNIFGDGLLQSTNTTDTYYLSDPPGVGIGHSYGTSDPMGKFEGQISEAIVHDRYLILSEKIKIETYLAVKYGITLGNTSTTVSYIATEGTTIWPGDAVYQNDIAGIGRDDIEGLNQKQSKSEHRDAIFTIGLGAIQATNADNTNTFATDVTYFIWGNDNGALSSAGVTDVGMTVNGENIATRLDRVWKSVETKTVGTVKVRVDMSQIPGVAGLGDNNLANLRLLVDPDGVFASGATSIAPSFYDNASDILEFDHDFTSASGLFFTLGSTNFSDAPLPVELASFTAESKAKDVQLNWATASELNNKIYLLERSQDGKTWFQAGSVPGSGTTHEYVTYSFTDKNVEPGTWYFRLKQVDEDDSFSYSFVVSATVNSVFRMYPNPAKDYLFVVLSPEHHSNAELEILNHVGQPVFSSEIFGGKNQIPLSAIPSGLYTVKVKIDSTIVYEKFVKN